MNILFHFQFVVIYVAYLSSCFGNSKMVTECELKPISMNFGSPRRGRGFICGRHGAGLDWPEEKDNFSNNILLIFAAIKISSELMLPIYYGTSSLTFCQISGLKEAFEKTIKHQTALKFEF